MTPDGEVPIGDPAIWGPTSGFGFLSAWANCLGCDFFPWFGVHFGLLLSGVSPHCRADDATFGLFIFVSNVNYGSFVALKYIYCEY